jgi:hypothetical protein
MRIDIACATPCHFEVDGRAAGSDAGARWLLYVEPSSHRLVARFRDGTEVTRRAFGGPGTEIALRLTPSPAPRTDARADRPSGLDRRWVGLGLGATAALVGTALWSWSDARDAAVDPHLSADPLIARGRERRTTALLGASLATATATAILAMFTDWSSPREFSLGASPTTGGALVGVGGAF